MSPATVEFEQLSCLARADPNRSTASLVHALGGGTIALSAAPP